MRAVHPRTHGERQGAHGQPPGAPGHGRPDRRDGANGSGRATEAAADRLAASIGPADRSPTLCRGRPGLLEALLRGAAQAARGRRHRDAGRSRADRGGDARGNRGRGDAPGLAGWGRRRPRGRPRLPAHRRRSPRGGRQAPGRASGRGPVRAAVGLLLCRHRSTRTRRRPADGILGPCLRRGSDPEGAILQERPDRRAASDPFLSGDREAPEGGRLAAGAAGSPSRPSVVAGELPRIERTEPEPRGASPERRHAGCLRALRRRRAGAAPQRDGGGRRRGDPGGLRRGDGREPPPRAGALPLRAVGGAAMGQRRAGPALQNLHEPGRRLCRRSDPPVLPDAGRTDRGITEDVRGSAQP